LLRRLEWTVIRRLDGLLQGDYRTLMRGAGLDLADLREYQHHDDVRHIDWNVTARLQVPHVRVFTEDREMAAWFLLDLSPSSTSARPTSASRPVVGRIRGGAGAAAHAPRQPRRRAAVRHGRRHRHPRARRAPPRAAPAAHHATPARREGRQHRHPTARAADGGPQRGARRSLVFVVSDFISEPGWEKPLGQLALRHEVVAVRLFDPLELELPDLGLLTVRDAETGEQLLVDTTTRAFASASRASPRSARPTCAALAHAGVDTLELSTDGDLVDAVVRFADLRRQRTRRGHGRRLAAPPAPGGLSKPTKDRKD
jgi:uncharacterized protein (DUF58 family)